MPASARSRSCRLAARRALASPTSNAGGMTPASAATATPCSIIEARCNNNAPQGRPTAPGASLRGGQDDDCRLDWATVRAASGRTLAYAETGDPDGAPVFYFLHIYQGRIPT